MKFLLAGSGEAGRYLDWGFVHVSLTNALLILAVIVLFVLALVLPFPHGRSGKSEGKQ